MSHPSPSPTREIPLDHSLRNEWRAVAVRYEDDSSFAKVRFQHEKWTGTVIEAILPTDYLGDFLNESPALKDAPPGAIDYLIASVSAKITCDRLDRHSEERARRHVFGNGR